MFSTQKSIKAIKMNLFKKNKTCHYFKLAEIIIHNPELIITSANVPIKNQDCSEFFNVGASPKTHNPALKTIIPNKDFKNQFLFCHL